MSNNNNYKNGQSDAAKNNGPRNDLSGEAKKQYDAGYNRAKEGKK